MKTEKQAIKLSAILAPLILFGALLTYTVFGVETRIPEIERRAPSELSIDGFVVLRYEGYQRGSWMNHGGKAWYHVAESTNPNVRYRVCVTLWGGQLQLCYGHSEAISDVEVRYENQSK